MWVYVGVFMYIYISWQYASVVNALRSNSFTQYRTFVHRFHAALHTRTHLPHSCQPMFCLSYGLYETYTQLLTLLIQLNGLTIKKWVVFFIVYLAVFVFHSVTSFFLLLPAKLLIIRFCIRFHLLQLLFRSRGLIMLNSTF